jgi:cell division protein FtsQ
LAAVKNAEVFLSLQGVLTVTVEQRQPLVRVFNNRGESGYLDNLGHFMPLSHKYTARVLVANGHYSDGLWAFDAKEVAENDSLTKVLVLDDVYRLASFIDKHPFWKAQINQVYYNRNHEFELIPRVGTHVILLGKAEQIEEKFGKLFAFYKKGLPYTDWNRYDHINLKYKNQVVCTKK